MNTLRRPLSRAPYAIWSIASLLLYHTAVRVIISSFLHRNHPLNSVTFDSAAYYFPELALLSLPLRTAPEILAALIAVTVLFTLLMMRLTARRLSDAGLPIRSAWAMAIPGVNFLLWLGFGLMPSRPEAGDAPPVYQSTWSERINSAGLAALATAGVGVVFVTLATKIGQYTWVLFVALPFFMGLLAARIHTREKSRTRAECIFVSLISVFLLALLLLGIAIEGAICLLMAAPIALPLTMLGGAFGYALQGGRHSAASLTMLLLCIPGMMGADYLDPPVAPRIEIVTVFEIAAPPEVVWRNLIAFPEIGAPSEWLFRNGVSYPRQARIVGRGVGAFRFCDFSTGTFIERITAWEENRRMDFRVVAQPSTMSEMSPYPDLHPTHLDGYLHPELAQFTLTPLPGGRTRLEGRSFYKNEMWPMTYWRVWSDAIIKRVHRRVFGQIKRLSEREAERGSSGVPPGPA